jgi:hypothetical protein
MPKALWMLATAAATVTLVTVAFGYAASLARTSNTLGSTNAAVTRCDTDGIVTTPTSSAGNVTGASVSGIAPACASLSLKLTVNNGTTFSSGTTTVPAGGGSANVTLAASVAVKDTMQINVAIG